MKKKKNKILDRFFNAVGPGLPHNNIIDYISNFNDSPFPSYPLSIYKLVILSYKQVSSQNLASNRKFSH